MIIINGYYLPWATYAAYLHVLGRWDKKRAYTFAYRCFVNQTQTKGT